MRVCKDRNVLIQRIEFAVGLLLTFIIIFLHLTLMQHSAGLWRDEVNSINIATTPSLSDVWTHSEYDSSPILWFLVLRLWAALGWATSDAGFRILGLLVGTSIVAVLWLNKRLLAYSSPLLSLTLIGLNPDIIYWGDSMRAYGLGICLILLVFGLMWKVTQLPTPCRVLLAAVVAILSVHCVYYNAILLLAIILGCMVVALRHGLAKRALLLLGIGLAAAVSIWPYASTIRRAQRWTIILKVQLTTEMLINRVTHALGASGRFMTWIWLGLFALAILAAVFAQVHRSNTSTPSKLDFCHFVEAVKAIIYKDLRLSDFFNTLQNTRVSKKSRAIYVKPWE